MNIEVAQGHFFCTGCQVHEGCDKPAFDKHQQHAPKQQQIADQQDQGGGRCQRGAAGQHLHFFTQALSKLGPQHFNDVELRCHDALEFKAGDQRIGCGQIPPLHRLHNARRSGCVVAITGLKFF